MIKVDRTAKELLNVPLGDFDDMRLICGEDQATGSYGKSVGDIPSESIMLLMTHVKHKECRSRFCNGSLRQTRKLDEAASSPEIPGELMNLRRGLLPKLCVCACVRDGEEMCSHGSWFNRVKEIQLQCEWGQQRVNKHTYQSVASSESAPSSEMEIAEKELPVGGASASIYSSQVPSSKQQKIYHVSDSHTIHRGGSGECGNAARVGDQVLYRSNFSGMNYGQRIKLDFSESTGTKYGLSTSRYYLSSSVFA